MFAVVPKAVLAPSKCNVLTERLPVLWGTLMHAHVMGSSDEIRRTVSLDAALEPTKARIAQGRVPLREGELDGMARRVRGCD